MVLLTYTVAVFLLIFGAADTDVVDSIKHKKHEKYCNYFVDSFCFHILPNTEKFKNLVALDEGGYIIAGEDCVTSTPGIFAAGDIRTKQLRQVVTAVADGANAVISAEKYCDV